MKNVMLIDAEAVRRDGYTNENVLPKQIDVTIRRVQQTMLREVMGYKAYNDLLDKVSASLPPSDPIVPLDPDTATLLKEYIRPYLIAAVDYKIILPLTLRLRSKSVGKGTDENHTPADVSELIKLKDEFRSDVDSYERQLIDKLSESTTSCCDSNKCQATTPWKSIKFR